jgi:hypothetical protein
MPVYLQVIFSFTSALVAICAVMVLVAQWTTASRKLQSDLFERRWERQASELTCFLWDVLRE